tara:strand:+ start:86 stop:1552 length:1467 start_codon:yes stop_codon:yes gene_type:complete
MPNLLIAIDQGTTSSRTLIFTPEGDIVARAQQEIVQQYPQDGWVEHDPELLWQTVFDTCRQAIDEVDVNDIAAIGISNQRETTIIWDRKTGKPIHNAIVWQDRRTADDCYHHLQAGHEPTVQQKTGLLLDPYFSATKIKWLLDNVKGARAKAENGELAFGTVDTFLLWRLTEGRVHATDATNASRTMLFNIETQQWDDELLSLFNVPKALLPEVKNSSDDFGECHLFGKAIAIGGVAGDQQAASFGQTCFTPGMVKSTYGTGCFVMLNTGENIVRSKNRLLSTVAYRLNGKPTYAVEGSIFIAGAAVQWLRDAAHLIGDANDTEALAQSIEDTGGVYLVPAFTGLGAPYWDPQARGAILGLTRDSGVAHIVRAALEAVCYQTKDLMHAMYQDGDVAVSNLRVDGGMVPNNWLIQFLSDILNVDIERPKVIETSALGAAYLAGLHVGVYQSLDDISSLWQSEHAFTPNMLAPKREALYQGWLEAVKRIL